MTELSAAEAKELERLAALLSDEPPKAPPPPPRTLIKKPNARKAKRARVKAARKRNR